MLDVQGSLKNLQWTVTHHFLHIQNQHDFMRDWAVQFELAYTDFRMIQVALQLDGQTDLLKQFTSQYNEVYQYEMAFAGGGLEGFNEKFGDKIPAYEKAHNELLATIDDIFKLQPTDQNDLV